MKFSTTISALASIGVAVAADCPPVGTMNAAGDYSCNPAHEYPNQACALIGDCYFLRGLGLATATPTTSIKPTSTACPPAGSTNAAGDYSCNPAHEYPNQACALIGDCYYLRGLGYITPSSTTSTKPTSTACPPAGSTNPAGDYSCNPAHSYPGQVCALIGDCYFLRGLGFGTSTITTPTPHPKPTPKTCPPVGSCNAAGLYSCNPAHTYPNQACVLIDDCYYLRATGSNVPTLVPTKPTSPAIVTGGAAQLSAAGGLAIIGFFAALL